MSEQQILAAADARIEEHRKADAVVRVTDGAGRPVPGATVRVEQTRHAFLFGCNAFPLLTWDDPEQEAAYERALTGLMNYATLAFYWGTYEPRPGRTREAHRRRQAEWCRAHGIVTKGHPLVWHEVYPTWGPSDVQETKDALRGRVTEIVSGFAGLIDTWDVVNEATSAASTDTGIGRWAEAEGPATIVTEAMSWARTAGPGATLIYNDYDVSESGQRLVADVLRAHPGAVDVTGIQSHMHRGEWELSRVWEVCEAFSRFGRPIHFTETTVVSGEHGWDRPLPWPTTPEGEQRQADYVEKFYTVLFSHPSVQAITWWDLQDGAWMGAPSGLIRADLTPKPAYERLLKLIKDRWWTQTEVKTDADGIASFRGVLGHYRITVEAAAGRATEEMDVVRDDANMLRVSLE
jgi:endo-1,4-beta-xylanase